MLTLFIPYLGGTCVVEEISKRSGQLRVELRHGKPGDPGKGWFDVSELGLSMTDKLKLRARYPDFFD
tara:strand:+ start:430 stop:630 length:201 start_codon:yes stop_codon:yes gene_type:complete